MTEPLTITAAAEQIQAGTLTPRGLLEQCIARIERYEPAVKAWAYLDLDRARADADRLGEQTSEHPLHGIPIGIKDIIDVADMPTGCGSRLWANSYARTDATVVRRLREAGAIILGKTVTTPYAFTDPPSTRNPWNLAHTPGGSSSGSAAAVACGMCLAALGSQTGGSLTRPASYCGVNSLKPSHGRISLQGVLPLAPSLDHLGILGRSVEDLAIVYEAIAGWDAFHPDMLREVVADCRRAVQNSSDRHHELWAVRGAFEERCEPEMLTAMAPVWGRYPTTVLPGDFATVWQHHRTIMSAEAATVHAERFARRPEDYPPKITALIRDGLAHLGTDIVTSFGHQGRLQQDWDDAADRKILITPAATGPAPDAGSTGDAVFNSPWSYLGVPTVSIPFAMSAAGLPLGLQLSGWHLGEADLLAAAAGMEHDFPGLGHLPPVPG